MNDRFPFKTLLICCLIGAIVWSYVISAACQQPYKVTPAKVATWVGFGIAGATWGAREAYHADPTVFEEKWGVDEYSFFGSKAWERQYTGNRYYNAAGGINPHKTEWGNTFRDFWHFSGASSRVLWLGGTFTIGAGKQPLKHKLLDLGIGLVCSSVSGFATYQYLRK